MPPRSLAAWENSVISIAANGARGATEKPDGLTHPDEHDSEEPEGVSGPAYLFCALRKNLTGPAILAGLVFRGKRYPPPSWLGKCGNPASVAGFPSAVGTVEKSGLDFPRFPRRAISTAKLWILGILARMPSLGTTGGSTPHFSEPATDAHFSRFLRRALFFDGSCVPQSVNTARIEVHSFDGVTLTDRQFLTGAKEGKASRIGGELCLPPGACRFPVVVLVHGSAGVGAGDVKWSQELNKIGVATFLIDCFTG